MSNDPMSGGPWLTRARLRRTGSAAALVKVLTDHAARDAGHALIWSLFADGPDRRRDFLWRADDGLFYILSARPPVDAHGLFEIDPPKPFVPALAAGDVLAFSLRANPVVRHRGDMLRPDGKSRRVKKDDVVMNAIRPFEKADRADARNGAIRTAGFEWLSRTAGKSGFAVSTEGVRIEGYTQTEIPRDAGQPLCFSTLDFDGRLTVTDADLFARKIAGGFGSARAYGCGLMLIRRA
jgi:CRISPR system Cascade subunit CasE